VSSRGANLQFPSVLININSFCSIILN
jgi:hypothetical protein